MFHDPFVLALETTCSFHCNNIILRRCPAKTLSLHLSFFSGGKQNEREYLIFLLFKKKYSLSYKI